MAVEVSSQEELEAWLGDKPREWAQVIALRAALRVLPLACDPNQFGGQIVDRRMPLTVFRTSAISFGLGGLSGNVIDVYTRTAAARAAYAAKRAYASANTSPAYATAAAIAPIAAIAADADAATAAARASAAAASAAATAAATAEFYEARALDAVWKTVQDDCQALEEGVAPDQLMRLHLWPDAPEWWSESWDNARRWLSRPEDGFDIWREWYHGRVQGLAHVFARFDEEADQAFYRYIIEQDDEWWIRESAEVNAEIKAKVSELRSSAPPGDADLAQNSLVLTFSTDDEGRTVLDPEVAPNGLQDDADAADNHHEIKRLTNAALASTQDAPTQQKAIAEPTLLLSESLGNTVSEVSPRKFILRARELMRQVDELESEATMDSPLSELQRKAYLPLVEALRMLITFDPKLAQLWEGKVNGETVPLTRDQLDILVQALAAQNQTRPDAQEVLETVTGQVRRDADVNDPARRTASEMVRNAFRAMGRAVKRVDGVIKGVERIVRIVEKGGKIWTQVRDKLPDDDIIARILEWLFKGGGSG